MSGDFNINELFGEEEPVAEEQVEQGPIVTMVTPGGEYDVSWQEGMTLRDAINALEFSPSATAQFWVNGSEAGMDTVLPEGATITSVGKVAGG